MEEKKERGTEVIDVEAIMAGVRDAVARKIDEGVFSRKEIEAVRAMELSVKEKRHFGIDMDEYVQYLHANWDPTGPIPITSHRPLLGRIIVPFKRLTRRLLRPVSSLMLQKQAEFNSHITRLVTSVVVNALPLTRDRLEQLDERFMQLLVKYYELVKRNRQLSARVDELLGQVHGQGEALASLRGREAAEPAAARGSAPGTEPSGGALDYLSFEDRHRGPSGEVKERQREYVELFRKGPVLDAGCGRGEFLELLAEAGIEAYGVDLNADMVKLCAEKGLRVERADLLQHLASLEEASLGGIFAAQVAEHLTSEELADLVRLAHAKLAPGGVAVIETINPACLTTFAGPIYLDPTHTKPIHPEAMRFLLEAAGFPRVEIRFASPFPADAKLRQVNLFHRLQRFDESLVNVLNDNINQLNELLYGCQDYAAVATR